MCRKMVVTSDPRVTAATGASMTAAGKYPPAQLIQRWSFQRSHRDQSGLFRGWASEDRTNPVLHVVSMGRGSEGVVDRAVGTSGSVRKHTNQGTVLLHGRLFAWWVHHASPRECPCPHTAGSDLIQTPHQWLQQAGHQAAAASRHWLAVVQAADQGVGPGCGDEADRPWASLCRGVTPRKSASEEGHSLRSQGLSPRCSPLSSRWISG